MIVEVAHRPCCHYQCVAFSSSFQSPRITWQLHIYFTVGDVSGRASSYRSRSVGNASQTTFLHSVCCFALIVSLLCTLLSYLIAGKELNEVDRDASKAAWTGWRRWVQVASFCNHLWAPAGSWTLQDIITKKNSAYDSSSGWSCRCHDHRRSRVLVTKKEGWIGIWASSFQLIFLIGFWQPVVVDFSKQNMGISLRWWHSTSIRVNLLCCVFQIEGQKIVENMQAARLPSHSSWSHGHIIRAGKQHFIPNR